MIPSRGCIIVKPVTTSETLGNGQIIIPEPYREQMASHQMIVVSVGADEFCQDDDCDRAHQWEERFETQAWYPYTLAAARPEDKRHRTDKRIKPGAWVIVRPRSLAEISAQDKLYSVKQSDVLGVFSEQPESVAE